MVALKTAVYSPRELLNGIERFVYKVSLLSLYWNITVSSAVRFSDTFARTVMFTPGSTSFSELGWVERLTKRGGSASIVKSLALLELGFPVSSLQVMLQLCRPLIMPWTEKIVATPLVTRVFDWLITPSIYI